MVSMKHIVVLSVSFFVVTLVLMNSITKPIIESHERVSLRGIQDSMRKVEGNLDELQRQLALKKSLLSSGKSTRSSTLRPGPAAGSKGAGDETDRPERLKETPENSLAYGVDNLPGVPEQKDGELLDPKTYYIGCFADSHSRDLPDLHKIFLIDPATCMTKCAKLGYKTAGLQAGSECWCGRSVGKYGPSTNCNQRCSGNPSYTCGGAFANDVYFALDMHANRVDPVSTPPPDRDPASSMWCQGTMNHDRSCRFRNLYFDPIEDTYMFYKTASSVIEGIDLGDINGDLNDIVDLNTVGAIPKFRMKLVTNLPIIDISYIGSNSLLFSRFLPYNIMHVIHDDLLGVYFTLCEYFPSSDPEKPYDLNTRLILADEHSAGAYIEMVQFLSDLPIFHHSELPYHTFACYENIVVGILKKANWYQYGFGKPQGPIPNKRVSGADVREFANFILQRASLPHIRDISNNDVEDKKLCIYSRTRNRLILNENELAENLAAQLDLIPVFLRLEDSTLREIIENLGTCSVVIGMHGSIMILNIFLPRNALVVELYPYAVPPNNYTPYMTMAKLPGMELKYVSWANPDKEKTVYHKDWHRLLGGITHLPEEEQKKIIEATTVPTHHCCEDPYWLFKIYQDTEVNIPVIAQLIASKRSK